MTDSRRILGYTTFRSLAQRIATFLDVPQDNEASRLGLAFSCTKSGPKKGNLHKSRFL
jgi:hypothetical protein